MKRIALWILICASPMTQVPAIPAPEPATEPSTVDAEATSDVTDGYQAMETLTRSLEIIRQNYVDEDKVGYDRLIASALRGILEDLDPHSQFLAPTVFEQMKQSQENTSEGVGVTISPKAEEFVIVSVREDGPAARAGVMPGDRLVKVAETMVEKMGYAKIVQLFRGQPGEALRLVVFRPTTKETKEFNLIREVLRQDSVRDAMLLDPSLTGNWKIGYVRLLQFNGPSAQELSTALDALQEKGLQALILDLRNNPGGLLISAVDILSEFLPPDTLVVTTEGRSAEHRPPPYKTKALTHPTRPYPLVVLVNHGSASASELTSGALQDLKRALVVGETTFGKGSVQTIIPGNDGTAIRLTTAKYFTPSHKTIHEKGITPDIVATLTPQEEKRIFQWRQSHPESSSRPQELADLGDHQLERAVTALKGVLSLKTKKSK